MKKLGSQGFGTSTMKGLFTVKEGRMPHSIRCPQQWAAAALATSMGSLSSGLLPVVVPHGRH